MEPEDTYMTQEIIKHSNKMYSFVPEYDDLIKTVVHKNRDGTMYKSVDLSGVSTRDLLNECYRRRAIEKFSASVSIDSYMLKAQPEAIDYVMRDLSREVWDSVVGNSKFYNDAMAIKETPFASFMRTEFTGEIYVCKHPTKVRK